ncbi:hypothetical protein Tcan_11028 [Toxocara canis]|uniref:UPAR/Ly6 domain-containing protein n=1 Tax=Toxocara canis TaxID=6265 RepID=A0A0B2W408_TOXCA|nr:hypothetical protein Tcan_11028 [Toxocara canis]
MQTPNFVRMRIFHLLLLPFFFIETASAIQCWQGSSIIGLSLSSGNYTLASPCAIERSFCVTLRGNAPGPIPQAYSYVIEALGCEGDELSAIGLTETHNFGSYVCKKSGCYKEGAIFDSQRMVFDICCCKKDFCNLTAAAAGVKNTIFLAYFIYTLVYLLL